jgi:multisubunit Na+/H+ antiporter MnhF subunit
MIASIAMIFGLAACGWLALAAKDVRKRLVAFDMAGIIATLVLMTLTMAFQRMPLMDLAIALALMSFGSGMAFAHFLARRL